MAQYTDQAEIEARMDNITLAQITDDRDSTIISTQAEATTALALAATIANITQAIEDASNKVDTELLGHVDLTDSDVLARIKPLTTAIAMYQLHLRRFMDEERNPYRGIYYDALKTLREARERKNRFAIDPDEAGTQTVSSTISDVKKISSTTLTRYV